MRAMQAYKRINGDLLVPLSFTIPEDDASWERDLWGTKLGITVSSIRNSNTYAEHKPELLEMGFVYDPQQYRWEKVKRALLAYKRIKDDLVVPQSFTIPEGDVSWVRDLWGMKLGITVSSIRNNISYAEHKPELLEMGFDYDPQQYR